MKYIKDYLPFYIGCDVKVGNIATAKLAYESGEDEISVRRVLLQPDTFKLILRPLSSMTQEEMTELKGNPLSCSFTPSQFRYLLSKHFDVFDLIEAGLAIDATTLQKGELS